MTMMSKVVVSIFSPVCSWRRVLRPRIRTLARPTAVRRTGDQVTPGPTCRLPRVQAGVCSVLNTANRLLLNVLHLPPCRAPCRLAPRAARLVVTLSCARAAVERVRAELLDELVVETKDEQRGCPLSHEHAGDLQRGWSRSPAGLSFIIRNRRPSGVTSYEWKLPAYFASNTENKACRSTAPGWTPGERPRRPTTCPTTS